MHSTTLFVIILYWHNGFTGINEKALYTFNHCFFSYSVAIFIGIRFLNYKTLLRLMHIVILEYLFISMSTSRHKKNLNNKTKMTSFKLDFDENFIPQKLMSKLTIIFLNNFIDNRFGVV